MIDIFSKFKTGIDRIPLYIEDDQKMELKLLREAIIAMAEDGWLYYGVEGPSKAQEKCLKAYRRCVPHSNI